MNKKTIDMNKCIDIKRYYEVENVRFVKTISI